MFCFFFFFFCRLVFRVFRACVFGVQIASFTFCFLFEFCLSHCSIIPLLYTLQIIRTLYIIYIHINIYSFFPSFILCVCACFSGVTHCISRLTIFGYADNRCLLGCRVQFVYTLRSRWVGGWSESVYPGWCLFLFHHSTHRANEQESNPLPLLTTFTQTVHSDDAGWRRGGDVNDDTLLLAYGALRENATLPWVTPAGEQEERRRCDVMTSLSSGGCRGRARRKASPRVHLVGVFTCRSLLIEIFSPSLSCSS
uniref:Uncharacterized protein n=1 Tax=Rhipicephalus microplus TaxID=6941 RepID=A0A6M2D7J4_RHIMP